MSDEKPVLSVVRGTPTDEELAAVIVVVTSLLTAPAPTSTPPTASGWAAPWRSVRQPLHPGPGAWRMSGRT